MLQLVVEEAGRHVTLVLATEERVTVGRGRSSTIVLTDPAASRDHCALERAAAGFRLVDLGSRNGTLLNGERVSKTALLRPGDRIEIGLARLTLEETEEAARPLRASDPDTGLLAAAAFRSALEERLLAGEPVAVVKLDLDALGLVNSLLGYEAGDLVIDLAAREADLAAREEDPRALLGHESGGKFVLLLGSREAARAAAVAEHVRERVKTAARRSGAVVASVTLSAGVALAPANGVLARPLLRAAEAALDEAKRSGRDRVVVAAPELAAAAGSGASRAGPLPGTESTGDGGALAANVEPLLREPAGRSALALVGHALASDVGLEGLGELALGVVVRETGATRGLLVLRDEGGELRLGAVVAPGAPRGAVAAASHGILRAALERKDGLLLDDAQADPELGANESVAAQGVRSVVAAPALWGDEAVAAIYLENNDAPGAFDDTHLVLLRALGRLIAGPIRRGLLHARALDELARARLALEGTQEEDARLLARYRSIVGRSAAIKKLLRTLDRVARRAVPVIVQGPSGTGKELVARALHARSPWAKGPFVAESCAALSEELLEAELFGYRKGAFTGAEADRIGLLEAAHGGTLFLDEVGEMSAGLQSKLLRFLQEGEVRRLGDPEVRRVSVRVVAATHRDLHALVAGGQFREDLYYRLAVVQLAVPSLSERREDIPLLVEHLAARAAHELGRAVPHFEPGALALLAAYDWPGNVRQLENEIRKLLALGLDPVEAEHLSAEIRAAAGEAGPGTEAGVDGAAASLLAQVAEGRNYAELLDALERRVIEGTLEATYGNRSETARRLGFTRTGLRMKMRRLGVSESEAVLEEAPPAEGGPGEPARPKRPRSAKKKSRGR